MSIARLVADRHVGASGHLRILWLCSSCATTARCDHPRAVCLNRGMQPSGRVTVCACKKGERDQ